MKLCTAQAESITVFIYPVTFCQQYKNALLSSSTCKAMDFTWCEMNVEFDLQTVRKQMDIAEGLIQTQIYCMMTKDCFILLAFQFKSFGLVRLYLLSGLCWNPCLLKWQD